MKTSICHQDEMLIGLHFIHNPKTKKQKTKNKTIQIGYTPSHFSIMYYSITIFLYNVKIQIK